MGEAILKNGVVFADGLLKLEVDVPRVHPHEARQYITVTYRGGNVQAEFRSELDNPITDFEKALNGRHIGPVDLCPGNPAVTLRFEFVPLSNTESRLQVEIEHRSEEEGTTFRHTRIYRRDKILFY